MNDQTNSSWSALDDEIKKKVRAALSDPALLARIAGPSDHGAAQPGAMQDRLEGAAALILAAGAFCHKMGHDSLNEILINLAEHLPDQVELIEALNFYSQGVEPDVLILSDDDSKDTLRTFLREHANFEGKKAKGKRNAWKTTRMVTDNLRLWFIDRTNEHNLIFGEERWLDGQEQFDKAKKIWVKGDCWHIPRRLISGNNSEAGIEPESPSSPRPDWGFIPWRKRMKGKFEAVRQMTRNEVLAASKPTCTPVEIKRSDSGGKSKHRSPKMSAGKPRTPKQNSGH